MLKAFIVWHYYKDGKLINYGITKFEGNEAQLDDCLRNGVTGEPRNKGTKESEERLILHQVVLL